MEKPYAVNLWGSHPEEGNDDCWTGDEFDTLAEAKACADDWREHFGAYYARSTVFVEIDGIDYHEDRRVAKDRKREDDDGEWKRERAMQAGMAFGCDGYNDEMGW